MLDMWFALSVFLLTQGLPDAEKQIGVPDPIPADICVEVHWRVKHDVKISVYHPPLDRDDIDLLTRIRTKRLGDLKRCRLSKT